ncbi:galactose-3-O-sulfotransferase 2-like [Saccoglossus kowalevskii]|uniref:Galactose-3-O-sulfotransferase 2-like n=1 Tax=Saccoglossus kowalevskii TaxID=10224 RepID=A0ABM0MT99_SACKO|nr:PREDICTED: galactose-3-O-sulfotransferase 2-like [Saccoglossus kowalevskii]
MARLIVKKKLLFLLVVCIATTVLFVARMHEPHLRLLEHSLTSSVHGGDRRSLQLSELIDLARRQNIAVSYPSGLVPNNNLSVFPPVIQGAMLHINESKHFYGSGLESQQPVIEPTVVTRSSPNETCRRHNNVVFLKTHKTGSDTTSQIFVRFADTHNLSIVLPTETWNLGWPSTVREKKYIHSKDNAKFNILCLHCVYNRNAFDNIMADGTKYVTILRNPWNQFKSAFNYFGWSKLVEKENENTTQYLEKFLEHPGRFYKWENETTRVYMRNFMSFDLGLPPTQYDDVNAIMTFVKMRENEFDLVMILEYYDESLILLRRMLCWKLRDILYIPINVSKKTTHVQPYAEQLYRHFSQADFTLYEHFKEIFLQRLKKSPSLSEEVTYFRQINSDYKLFCTQAERNSSMKFEVNKSDWNDMFQIDSSYCTKSRLPITAYVSELKQKHYGIDTVRTTHLWRIP